MFNICKDCGDKIVVEYDEATMYDSQVNILASYEIMRVICLGCDKASHWVTSAVQNHNPAYSFRDMVRKMNEHMPTGDNNESS